MYIQLRLQHPPWFSRLPYQARLVMETQSPWLLPPQDMIQLDAPTLNYLHWLALLSLFSLLAVLSSISSCQVRSISYACIFARGKSRHLRRVHSGNNSGFPRVCVILFSNSAA